MGGGGGGEGEVSFFVESRLFSRFFTGVTGDLSASPPPNSNSFRKPRAPVCKS